MKLIYASASPFVRKVHVALLETGLIEHTELAQVTTTPVNSDDNAIAANPAGKIPALILEDGTTIYDSRVICRYLNDRAEADLYPQEDLWNLLTLEASADAIMEALVLMTYERRIRPEELVYAPWIEAQWAKAERSIIAINNERMELLSGPLNMSQIAVACALNYAGFRHADRDWRGSAPQLAAWFEEFSKRPAMASTVPA